STFSGSKPWLPRRHWRCRRRTFCTNFRCWVLDFGLETGRAILQFLSSRGLTSVAASEADAPRFRAPAVSRRCHPERQRRTPRPSRSRLGDFEGLRLGTGGPSEYLRVTIVAAQ